MIGMTWTGWDGSVWDLRTGPVRLTNSGLSGLLNMIEPDDVVRSGAELDGQDYIGYRAQPRTGLFPVLIGPFRDEGAFLENEHKWWRTMRPGKVGTLEVTMYHGTTRRLSLRMVNDGLDSPPNFGAARGRTYVAPMKVVADDPWWYGDRIGATYSAGSGFNFFDARGQGLLTISKSNTVAKATFTNKGDTDAWPVYTQWGPATKVLIELGGGRVEYSKPLLSGEKLVVDTSPLRKIAWRYPKDGSTRKRVTRDLDAIDFRPIPGDGAAAELRLTVIGTGKFQIAADTRYLRAWG